MVSNVYFRQSNKLRHFLPFKEFISKEWLIRRYSDVWHNYFSDYKYILVLVNYHSIAQSIVLNRFLVCVCMICVCVYACMRTGLPVHVWMLPSMIWLLSGSPSISKTTSFRPSLLFTVGTSTGCPVSTFYLATACWIKNDMLLPLTFQQVLWIHTQVVRLHIKTDTHEPSPHSTRHSSWESVCLWTKDGCVTIFNFYFFSAFPSLLLLYTIKHHELSPPPQVSHPSTGSVSTAYCEDPCWASIKVSQVSKFCPDKQWPTLL